MRLRVRWRYAVCVVLARLLVKQNQLQPLRLVAFTQTD